MNTSYRRRTTLKRMALMELENVKFEDIPDDLQKYFIQAHTLLLHISTLLKMRLEMEEEE